MKICVYAISKNEAHFVKRFCDSAKDANLIVIADTGSTDDTVEIAKGCGASVYSVSVTPWRFDHARTIALALVPEDFDICVSLDLDEVLVDGWRKEVERLWLMPIKGSEEGKQVNVIEYLYDWGDDLQFFCTKIHSRHGWLWNNICHEKPFPDPRTESDALCAHTDVLLIKQLRDPSKSRCNYVDLLKADVDENPTNAKTRFYYGRELGTYLNYNECITQFDKCLELDEIDRNNQQSKMTKSEISFVCITKARCLDLIGDHTNAKIWFDISCKLCPESRDPYVYYALSCFRQSQWELCYSLILKALSIEKRELLYTDEPYHWESKPWYLASITAWNLCKIDEARKYGAIALEYTVDPTDDEIIPWIYYYAVICSHNSEWDSCYAAAIKCIRPVITTEKEREFACQILNLVAISSWNMGNKSIAIKYGEIACKYDPNNENIKNNYIFYTTN